MTSSADPIDAVWEEIRRAFAFYGKKVRPAPNSGRRKRIEELLAEYSPGEIPMAIHGYVRLHEGLDPQPGEPFNPRKYFTFETIYTAHKVELRIEEGEQGAWTPRPSQSNSRYRDASEVMADARRKQAEDDARRERKTNPLSVVGEG